ncbi:MAG: succinyldiaminopimelate transaminase [Moraxellaceae bacterium]|jgi:N-succinyldiaminopimelate aminotransferase|nr:succinyldiaminopimelate transaminase [Moraxellaceae bacterium]
MNPDLGHLQAYPFEKLAALFKGTTPPVALKPIALSIGEPKHPAPEFIKTCLQESMGGLSVYPTTKGIPELRQSIGAWLTRRFALQGINPETQVLPVNGTREALFSFTQAVVDRAEKPLVVMPDPFYQIYEGAALLAGAEPCFLPCSAENGFVPDYDAVPDVVWAQTQLLFMCSPGNPTGAVTNAHTLKKLIALADRFDFVIAADECYSEIYFDEATPPVGLLQVCADIGRHDFARCVVFHSLSKRSNLPGMRSGFVAGDAALLGPYLLYRTYHGSAMPLQHQRASIAAWSDEAHVQENRRQYSAKFAAMQDILGDSLPLSMPDAGFYFWAATPIPDDEFARRLYNDTHVTVLPGRFLGRDVDGCNPGAGFVRMALVAPLAECEEAARRIRDFVKGL